MKNYLCVGVVMLLCASALAQPTGVDGIIGAEWDGAIIIDPDDNESNEMEMTRWGARSDGTYLYWFAELGDGRVWADFQGGSDNKKMYPGLWGDFDASTGTYLSDDGTANCADGDKEEWATNHRGIDLNIEWGTDMSGTINYWGDTNTEPDPDVPGDVSVSQSGGTDSYCGIVGAIIEVALKISGSSNSLDVGIANTDINPTTLGDYWMVAVGIQGKITGLVEYGYDVGTPIPVAMDGSAVLAGDVNLDGSVDPADYTIYADNYGTGEGWRQGDVNMDNSVDPADYTIYADHYGETASGAPVNPTPEPATMSLLGLGIFALIRRKK